MGQTRLWRVQSFSSQASVWLQSRHRGARQEQACIRRNTILIEQRTYPFLDLAKRRRPQRKRLFNRRWPRPRSSNDGCAWIQKRGEKATVVLEPRFDRIETGLWILDLTRFLARTGLHFA